MDAKEATRTSADEASTEQLSSPGTDGLDDAVTREPIELLAEEFMERHRLGETPSITEYTERYPNQADEIRELFPTIAAMEKLKSNKQEKSSDGRATLGSAKLERLGDFRIIREIGRGGMGIVYEAEQESLGRRVAVKVLPRQTLLQPKQLQRFQREAQTAAKLHHTNIVTVFGAGEDDGYHYIVMQYIDGIGLDDVLKRLGRTDSGVLSDVQSAIRVGGVQDPGRSGVRLEANATSPAAKPETRATYWRSVAKIGVQIAEALDYAHVQGTLHRDIKPANLLVDDQGFVWVADFGLAKAMEQNDVSQTGDIVGTLRYMSPEQFRGEPSPLSDVYSLGLTLYELLTLKPAIDDSDRRNLIELVEEGVKTAPRKINPAIPRDLETIVLKAAAHDRAKRYSSAGELAADLTRFLQDRPIHARRISSAERLWRWCRRNPAIATLSGTAVALLITVAVVALIAWRLTKTEEQRTKQALVQVKAERERTNEALAGESAQRKRYKATSELAVEALDQIYTKFAPDRRTMSESSLTFAGDEGEEYQVSAQPVLSDEAAKILESLLSYFDRLAEVEGDSTQFLEKAADANRRVGDIRQQLGQYDQALAAYTRAIEKYVQVGGDFATNIGRIRNELGNVYRSLPYQDERRSQSYDSHLAALKILQSVSDPDADGLYELARTYYYLGRRRPGAGRRPSRPQRPTEDQGDSRPPDYLEMAIGVLTKLHEEHPSVPDYRHLLALCYRDKSTRGASRHNAPEVKNEAVKILRELKKEHPNVAAYRYDLAQTYAMVDVRFLSPDDPTLSQIEQDLLRADQIMRQLKSEHPNVPRYAQAQIFNNSKLGVVLWRLGDLRDAELTMHQTMEMQVAFARRFDANATNSEVWLRIFRGMLAEVTRELGELDQARDLLDQTTIELQELLAEDESNAFVHYALRENYRALVRVYEEMEDMEAVAWMRELYQHHSSILEEMRRGRGGGRSERRSD